MGAGASLSSDNASDFDAGWISFRFLGCGLGVDCVMFSIAVSMSGSSEEAADETDATEEARRRLRLLLLLL